MKKIFERSDLFVVLFLFSFQMIFAMDYYCDTVNGKNSNDGGKSSSWGRLESIINDRKIVRLT